MRTNMKLTVIIFLASTRFFLLSSQNFNLYNTEEKIIPAISVEDTYHVF